MTFWKTKFVLAQFLAITCFAVNGCGDGSGGVSVSGKVTLDGKPLPAGLIIFVDNAGAVVSTNVTNGEYKAFVPKGPHKVQITADPPAGGAGPLKLDEGGPSGTASAGQAIPAKYNTNTELQVTIESGKPYDFALTSN